MNVMTKLTFAPLETKAAEILDRLFEKKDCMMEVSPGRVVMPAAYREIGQDILDLPVMETDVWMCSHPRTGSTWAQEMVWLVGHDLDYEGAAKIQQIRCPIVELSGIFANEHGEWLNESIKCTTVDLVRHSMCHPRYIRSHLPWQLLPTDINNTDGSVKPKVIYTSRNPKDIVVSYYHYLRLAHRFKGTFEEFCELFLQDRAPIGPVWNHIFGFWNRRNDPNVLFIKFEEMKRDLPAIIRKTAKFLNKSLSEKNVEELCEHLSFSKMKTNRAVNMDPIMERSFGMDYLERTDMKFIRKGEIGDWKNYMSDDLSRKFDTWSDMHLRDTDLSFE